MRPSILFAAFCTAVAAVSSQDEPEYPSTADIYVQGISTPVSPVEALARIQYNPLTLDAEITSYDAPAFQPDAELARVGTYDTAAKAWTSSTSATSVENFGKGYAPVVTLVLDAKGAVLGVSCRSEEIDAGQTRDFGPKVSVVHTAGGVTPELVQPVVPKDGGKAEESEEPEKTFLQKYWMIILGVTMLALVTGGGDK